jgi:hypothetical protein
LEPQKEQQCWRPEGISDSGRRLMMTRLLPWLMFFVAFYPVPAQAELPTTPEGVLAYVESVYKNADIAAYEALLANDYRFVDFNGGIMDRGKDVRGTRLLFETSRAELSFDRDFSIHPGPQPETWIIENVPVVMKATGKDGRTNTVKNTFSLTIRNEGGQMLLTEWRQKKTN